jgi:hypothetical protein
MKLIASFAIEAKNFIACKGKMLHFCFMDTDTEVQANLKIPKSLKEKLKIAAKENHRSMTAEVVARLQGSFEPGLSQDTAMTLVAGLQQVLNEAREMQEEARRQREEAEKLLEQVRRDK